MSSYKKMLCEVCGREITKQENEEYNGLCWECWDGQQTEEPDSLFGEII